ncbi:MAG: hypothetical protein OXN83_02800, partial [Oligoflexia bacterium]|nr:hypothetical protein [Oligoflexia bacterium]
LEESVSLLPIVLLIGFTIISFIALIFFIFYLKTFNSFYLKNLLIFLIIFTFLSSANSLLLKEKVSLFTETDLKLAPIESAPNTVKLSPLEELIVLKKTKKWLKIKNQKKETGWILKQQVFQIF